MSARHSTNQQLTAPQTLRRKAMSDFHAGVKSVTFVVVVYF